MHSPLSTLVEAFAVLCQHLEVAIAIREDTLLPEVRSACRGVLRPFSPPTVTIYRQLSPPVVTVCWGGSWVVLYK